MVAIFLSPQAQWTRQNLDLVSFDGLLFSSELYTHTKCIILDIDLKNLKEHINKYIKILRWYWIILLGISRPTIVS